jgi:hypothetical protein
MAKGTDRIGDILKNALKEFNLSDAKLDLRLAGANKVLDQSRSIEDYVKQIEADGSMLVLHNQAKDKLELAQPDGIVHKRSQSSIWDAAELIERGNVVPLCVTKSDLANLSKLYYSRLLIHDGTKYAEQPLGCVKVMMSFFTLSGDMKPQVSAYFDVKTDRKMQYVDFVVPVWGTDNALSIFRRVATMTGFPIGTYKLLYMNELIGSKFQNLLLELYTQNTKPYIYLTFLGNGQSSILDVLHRDLSQFN